MKRRVDGARHDSDVALFYDLLGYCELLTKLTTLALVSAIEEDDSRSRYRLEYDLVRADGIGAWSATLRELTAGGLRRAAQRQAPDVVADLTSRHRVGDGSWQSRAVEALNEAGRAMDAAMPSLEGRVFGWMWFDQFPSLRNRTRGHGAPRPGPCRTACPLLEESTQLIAENLTAFRRPWALVHRHLSGKVRVAPLNEAVDEALDARFAPESLTRDGVYVLYDAPRFVPLLECESDQMDFRLANGAFNDESGRFELLSYVRDERRTADGTDYLTPPDRLPASDTQGAGALAQLGRARSNLPTHRGEYIRRASLEDELTAVLNNDRHPMVTLLGAGGVGKTSLALRVLQDIGDSDRFGTILWFSARDVDLLESGPKPVSPHVRDADDMAAEFDRLMSVESAKPRDQLTDALSNGLDGRPVLFAFDNFETARSPSELYRWLDTYVRNPNAVLITTRQRSFRGDFPIEVRGMARGEFYELLDTAGARLGIRGKLGEERKDELFREADGHPYVAKVLLSELARSRRGVIKRIVASRDDILVALFERTFTSLPAAAQRVFLSLSMSQPLVSRVVLDAVLLHTSRDRFDVEAAVDRLQQSSLIEIIEGSSSEEELIRVPAAASAFGQQKMAVSPLKVQVQKDIHFLRLFSPDDRATGDELQRRVDGFFDRVVGLLQSGSGTIDDYVPIMEYIARRRPRVWLLAAELMQDFRPGWVGLDRAAEFVRNYLEQEREDREVWIWLSELAAEAGDYLGAVTALLERAAIPDANYADISYAASRLNEFDANHSLDELPQEDRDALQRRSLELLEPRADEASATDCATIAWLLLKQRNRARAREYVRRGLQREPANPHCLRLDEILKPRATQVRGTQMAPVDARRLFVTNLLQGIEQVVGSVPSKALRSDGLLLSQLGSRLRQLSVDVDVTAHGFKNFTAAVETAVRDSGYCVVRRSPKQHPRLALRDAIPEGMMVTDGFEPLATAKASVEGDETGLATRKPKDPRIRAQLKGLTPISQETAPDEVLGHARRAIEMMLQAPSLRAQALSEGVALAGVGEAVRFAISDLRPLALGFRNVQELVLDSLEGSELALAVREGQVPPQTRVVVRADPPPGLRLLQAPDDPMRGRVQPPSRELYLRVLGQGTPQLRLPDPGHFHDVADWCARSRPVEARFADLLDQARAATGHAEEVVKLNLLTIAASRAFDRQPPNSPLPSQLLTFKASLQDVGDIIAHIRSIAERKIADQLGSVQAEILDDIFDARPGSPPVT